MRSATAQEASERDRQRGSQPAAPLRSPVLLINHSSGGGKAARGALAERARERGVRVVSLSPGQSLAALANEAVREGADALGVAGGDGSLSTVAAVACANELPLICVPAGTRNHFALDLGVDRSDMIGALDAFSDGIERAIDIAEVNGRLFLNNVSLGVYGDAVRQPAYRDSKLLTLLRAAAEELGASGEATDVRLVDDHGREHRSPVVVLVSNNPYSFGDPRVQGFRGSLCRGTLGVLVLDRLGEGPRLAEQAWTAACLEVSSPAPIHAGIDGEAVELVPPLRFVIRPAALRVRTSRRHPGLGPALTGRTRG